MAVTTDAVRRVCAAFALSVAAASPTLAQDVTFRLTVGGIAAGTLRMSSDRTEGSYSAAAFLQTTGLASVLRSLRHEAEVQGRITQGRLSPARYAAQTEVGQRQSQVEITWKDGQPAVVSLSPPPADAALAAPVDASRRAGTVDPVTALHSTLGDADAKDACALSLAIFDGRRLTRLVVGQPVATKDGLTCTGEYRRLAGFSPADMMEKSRFAFTLRLAMAADGRWQVREVTTETLIGRATLTRQ